MNVLEKIGKWLTDKEQQAGGKMMENFLKGLQIQGSGKIVMGLGAITITGQKLNLKVVDTDNKNAEIMNVDIPINITITPQTIEIPVVVKGDLK